MPEADLPPDVPRPGVLVERRTEYEPVTREYASLGDSWGRFFPTVAESEYPMPLTRRFWQHYREPVQEFLAAALRLGESAQVLANYDPSEDLGKPEEHQRIRHLETLCASATPILENRNGEWEQRWSTGSLLGSFAVMVMEDAASNALRVCEACGLVYGSTVSSSKWCSNTCARRIQTRRARANAKKTTKRRTKAPKPGARKGARGRSPKT